MSKEVEIICFGVGFGDCIYIKLPNDIQIIIDTGHCNKLLDVKKKLLSEGRNIDYVFLTHAHGDHIGGISQLIGTTELGVKGVFYWTPDDNNISKTNLKKIQQLTNISVDKNNMVHCEQIDKEVLLRIGEIFDKYIKILYPDSYSFHRYNTIDLNANSIVIDVIIDEYHLLFMGDATVENENIILEKCKEEKIDLTRTIFWKIGHHASDTASSENFMNTILGDKFKKAVCSCKESWDYPGNESKPPSVSKVNQINKKLSKLGENIYFTGETLTRRDIKMKFKFENGSVEYVPDK